MKYKHVLLCIPPLKGSAARKQSVSDLPEMPYVGLGYISEFLLKNGIDISVFDMRFGYSLNDLKKRIQEYNPDLIGFSMLTYNCFIGYSIISKIKSLNYKIVVGGAHASTLRKKVLEDCNAVDYVIKLEGEETLLDLCKGVKESNIKGLIYREGNNIYENEDREFIGDLDKLPFPKYGKFELKRYGGNSIPIFSSRGCPYSCIYCPIHAAIGKKYRVRSANNIFEELRYWWLLGYRNFIFLDDNFTLFPNRVYELCNLIEKNNLKELSINCSNGVRADKVDYKLLKRMREVGFDRLSFGVESANNSILKNIKKGESLEVIDRAIKDACSLGYDVGLFFIIGLPGETVSTFNNSIKFAMKYPVNFARFYNPIPFPQTELLEWARNNNYLYDNYESRLTTSAHHDSDIFFETNEFTKKDRLNALKKASKVNLYLLEKNMVRKLSKYSILGIIVAKILYSPYLYYRIRDAYQKPFIRKFIQFIIKFFNLKITHF